MTVPAARWTGVAIDCAAVEPVVAFYTQFLGYEVADVDPPGWAQLRSPDGGPTLNIQAEPGYEPPVWPEQPGRPAKMMHFEVLVADVESAVAAAVAAGASQAEWQPADRDPQGLRVMLDPAGHPFCLFVAGE